MSEEKQNAIKNLENYIRHDIIYNGSRKCKYCEENKTKKEKYFDITIINSCLVVGNECSEGCGYERARFNINYCPMCGRKLV